MNIRILPISFLFIIFCTGFISGCIGGTSQQSVYYIFHASLEKPLASNIHFKRTIGIGPVKIPEYLRRPQIVRQKNNNVLEINEFHRWGDSLDAQISGVLVENLSSLLNTPNVGAYPWKKPFAPSLQISIDFRHFEGNASQSASVEAVWWVLDTKNDKILLIKKSLFKEPTGTENYEAYVKALNTALEKLSQEIARGLIDVLNIT